jgi:hypothetical protein
MLNIQRRRKKPHASDDLLTLGNWYVLELKDPG